MIAECLNLGQQQILERRDEDLEAVEEQRVSLADHLRDLRAGERADDDRALAVGGPLPVDSVHDLARLLHGVDERQRHLVEAHAVKLGEQAVAEHLGGDAGAVGYEECGAWLCHRGCLRPDLPVK